MKLASPLVAFLLACLLIVILLGCGREGPLAGGATDTETGGAKAVGRIMMPGGGPAFCATVEMRKREYLREPSESVSSTIGSSKTHADVSGFFSFDSLAIGEYVFLANCGDTLLATWVATVIDTSGKVTLPTTKLQKPGRIKGHVNFSDGSRPTFLVRVYGLPKLAMGDSTGDFLLTGLPAGNCNLRISAMVPFEDSLDIFNVRVGGDSLTDIGTVKIGPRLKQAFTIVDGHLEIPGLNLNNPIIYDNDRLDNTSDDEFLWALASMGRVKLRATILPGIPSSDSLRAHYQASYRELDLARQAGLWNIPDPIAGAIARLVMPSSGRWEDLVPIANPGSDLIASEAAKATREHPLVVISEGSMTTVATAFLLDPSIADKMIVFGTFNFNRPNEDTLAVYLISKKCRFVAWGRGYTWVPTFDRETVNPTPGTRYGGELWNRYLSTTSPFDFFGDLSGLAFAYEKRVFNQAYSANLEKYGGTPVLNVPAPFDFIEIPVAANNFSMIQSTFWKVISMPEAYHPWPIPGKIAAVAYSALSGGKVDSSGERQAEVLAGMQVGMWADFRIQSDSVGAYRLEVKCRSRGGGHLDVSLNSGPVAFGFDIPADSSWSTLQSALGALKSSGGIDTVRIISSAGTIDLDGLNVSNPGRLTP
jgi:hypothetical protein